jgi:acetate kinase
MKNAILTVNIGSSTIKFVLFSIELLQTLYLGKVDISSEKLLIIIRDNHKNIVYRHSILAAGDHQQQMSALTLILDWLNQQKNRFQIQAVSHRIVHGGEKFSSATLINKSVIDYLETLEPLAPLHQPYNIAGIKNAITHFPGIPQIACFDSSFHLQQSAIARSYALPQHISPIEIKKYGFHGLSYQSILQTLPPVVASQKNIIAHLGSGASLCATEKNKSVATTMGFTPLDGLVMGTRCGSLDPGVVLYLISTGMRLEKLTEILYSHSGLLGVSGISSDMQVLLKSDDIAANNAVDLFVYRAMREICSLLGTINGLENLVFTAGIGENAPVIRQKICDHLAWLKLKISPAENAVNATIISSADSAIKVWVIPTNEEKIMAEHTLSLLNA